MMRWWALFKEALPALSHVYRDDIMAIAFLFSPWGIENEFCAWSFYDTFSIFWFSLLWHFFFRGPQRDGMIQVGLWPSICRWPQINKPANRTQHHVNCQSNRMNQLHFRRWRVVSPMHGITPGSGTRVWGVLLSKKLAVNFSNCTCPDSIVVFYP